MTSAPKRAMSNRDAAVAINSIAQHARPIGIGQSEFLRTQLSAPSQLVKIEGNVIFTRFDAAINWARKNSLSPMPTGLACCANELIAAAASRFDIARVGA